MGETHLKQEPSDTCTLIERYNFFSTKLHDYSSLDEFVTDLQHKSNLCNFLERDNIIRDFVILKVAEFNKEGLLPVLKDSLTFIEILSICRDIVPLKYVGNFDYDHVDDYFGKVEIYEGASEIKPLVNDTELAKVDVSTKKREKKTHVNKQSKRDDETIQEITFECYICERSFKKKEYYNRHMRKIHPNRDKTNPTINDKPIKVEQDAESNPNPKIGDFNCSYCSKPFETQRFLERHYLIKHNANKCGQCGKEFKSIKRVRAHKETHRAHEMIECAKCHNRYAKGKNYKSHMDRHRFNELKEDENADPIALANLRKRIVRARPSLCPICGKSLANKAYLDIHMVTHTGERKHACKLCPKMFLTKNHLRTHQDTHTAAPGYKCRFCSKHVKHRSYLRMHENEHLGIRKFPCTYCDKSFSCWSTRRYHMRLHTGERPFKCGYCEKAFAQPNGLKSHEKTHANEMRLVAAFPELGKKSRKLSGMELT